jgi:hypothetical protein
MRDSDDNDADDEEHADNERGYNGTKEPVKIETIDHSNGPAVIVGALQQNGHVIRAEGVGLLVVENTPQKSDNHRPVS